MNVKVQCLHCAKPFEAPREQVGRRVNCPECHREFVLTEFLLADPPDPEASSAGIRPKSAARGRGSDHTLSHSMLPIPAAARVPADEMLCRLEPETLRWVNITDAVEEFLGSPIERLRQRTFLEFLHPDDRALAADEFRRAGEIGERHDFILRIHDKAG